MKGRAVTSTQAPAPRSGGRPVFGCELAHPLPVLSVGLLILNDHVLKLSAGVPALVTGKLSDFAGLFFFPVLLFVLLDGVCRLLRLRPRRARLALFCAGLTALVFAAIKLDPAVNRLANAHWGRVVPDATDLVALVMVPLAWSWVTRRDWRTREGTRPPPGIRQVVVLVACWASIATPPPTMVRNYPAWELRGEEPWPVGCAQVDAWVSKSGKDGLGVTLRVATTGPQACKLELLQARVCVGEQRVHAAALPELVASATAPAHAYLPFVFDNEAAWNRGERHGRLELVVVAGGRRGEPTRALFHRWDGPHKQRDDVRRGEPPGGGSGVAAPDGGVDLAAPDGGGGAP